MCCESQATDNNSRLTATNTLHQLTYTTFKIFIKIQIHLCKLNATHRQENATPSKACKYLREV